MASLGHQSGVRGEFFPALTFAAIRRLERLLSPEAFHLIVALFIRARRPVKGDRPPIPLPDCLSQAGKKFVPIREKRLADYSNAVLEFFPDRLSTSKWRNRVEFDGLEHLESARKNRKPVVLAFSHFGPFFLLRYWLRAVGFSAATLVRGHSEIRSPKRRLADDVSPFPEIPTAFYQDQLRELVEFLDAGHPLLIAFDVDLGKQLQVPLDDYWQVRVASGPIRLAIRHQCELIPSIITDLGCWRFRIKFGPPVPQAYLRPGQEPQAVKQLIQALLPEIRAHPEQCVPRVLNLFQPAAPLKNRSLAYADPITAR